MNLSSLTWHKTRLGRNAKSIHAVWNFRSVTCLITIAAKYKDALHAGRVSVSDHPEHLYTSAMLESAGGWDRLRSRWCGDGRNRSCRDKDSEREEDWLRKSSKWQVSPQNSKQLFLEWFLIQWAYISWQAQVVLRRPLACFRCNHFLHCSPHSQHLPPPFSLQSQLQLQLHPTHPIWPVSLLLGIGTKTSLGKLDVLVYYPLTGRCPHCKSALVTANSANGNSAMPSLGQRPLLALTWEVGSARSIS